eukprot:Gregarina_sp_Pseudo_9__5922@NODE_945_length_2043_cov_188_372255_g886_i0_p4_GENE_NODE_945_length_2043_cov_188_372255_g886_i0NODE_945_length_2043_cov_188_372255_g886_i0_p4_ORF_typecomplete_len131_score26_21NuA4/PF09340_10/1_8e06_NODE_945_length_2043_cov_188_372255_g886_i014091801
MKFMSIDLRKRLKWLEKRIASMESAYIQNSYSLDGHVCNLLHGFSSNICLKSNPSDVSDADVRAENLKQKRIALTRSMLAGSTASVPSSQELEEYPDPSSPSVQFQQCLFSLTSLTSPITMQLNARRNPS